MADSGAGNEARVFGRLFGETFSGAAAFVGVAAVAAVAVLAEVLVAVASFMWEMVSGDFGLDINDRERRSDGYAPEQTRAET